MTCAGRDVAQLHRLVRRRDPDRLAAGPAVDREVLAEQLLARDQQVGLVLDDAAHVVGQAAVRVRDVRAALHHHDLGLLVQPAQARGARRAAGDAADDDHLHDVLHLPL